MALNFPTGFNITTNEPIDKRLVMTQEQMRDVVEAKMPSTYFCLCSTDNKIYIYNSTNESDSVYGKFRPLEDYLTFATDDAKKAIEAALSGSATITGMQSDITTLTTNAATDEAKIKSLQDDLANVKGTLNSLEIDGGTVTEE